MQSCSHNDNAKVIPTVSPFLWLRALPAAAGSSSSQGKSIPQITSDEACEKQDLHQLLLDAKSVIQQSDLEMYLTVNLTIHLYK